MQKTILLKSLQDTETIGQKIGARLKGGETIELLSDVGGGKTTLTTSIVHGAGSNDHVSSSIFTITIVYIPPAFDIYHFDFSRLPQAGLISHELHENIRNDKDV